VARATRSAVEGELMDLGLTGKRALITGASRGIGRATAEKLAAEGCALAICARGAETLETFAKELADAGTSVFARAVDVTEPGAVTAFVDDAAAALGGLDIAVSNVSAGSVKGPEQWETSLRADLLPLVDLIAAATPHLAAAGGGSIVSISSTFGFDTIWPSSPNSYGALKAAVLQHASAAAHQLAPQGIRVNSVSPGPIEFDGGDWGNMKLHRREVYDRVQASIPLGRHGRLDEVASAVVFLASPRAGYCVGTNLVCDGGMTSRVHY
jgi:3-oxoacyl-[acyl-carrier protein] reductase